VEARIGDRVAPFRRAVSRSLNTTRGVSETVARVIVAEIGIDARHAPVPAGRQTARRGGV